MTKSRLMLPLGFLTGFVSILAPSELVVAFGRQQHVEAWLWTIYGASISAGLVGIAKSWSVYRSSISASVMFNESWLRFYTGWVYFALIVLALLLFAYSVENFQRTHPYVMIGRKCISCEGPEPSKFFQTSCLSCR